jgi:hypothetical membrane protein
MRSIGEKGFVLGGLVILLAAYSMSDSKTLIPTSVKIVGGIFLILYGVFRILNRKQ